MAKSYRKPTLIEAFIPIILLIILLGINVSIFGDDGLSGSTQVVLLLAAAIASLMAGRLGMDYKEMVEGVVESISSAMSAILILLMIGALAGTWLISGIVPAMIYYGLQILNPSIFLFAACIICAIVSIATGSSWSTVATIGVALIGIGQTLGLNDGVVAGAIISGAYFGDKMSPLSDTTNLAPAMAGTDLFTHIRYMAYTTIPSISITLVIFLLMGFMGNSEASSTDVNTVLNAIEGSFNLSPLLFLVPVAVIIMIVKKVPAMPALLVGSLLGGIFALIFQYPIVESVAKTIPNVSENDWMVPYAGVIKAMYGDVAIVTTNEQVNSLLSSSGMGGMLNTIWLILSAMMFGGVMEKSGMLQCITGKIIVWAKSTGSLIAATAGTCIFFNGTSSDQYLAIVVPGRMFADTYRKRKLAPENLSRTLEDSGTVTSVLIPWNTCGATQSSVLHVATGDYAMYCFFCIISPIMTVLFGYLNIKIRKLEDTTTEVQN